jgi:hypothetical protein
MNGSLHHLPEVWKQRIEQLKKSKSYREGRKAAQRGEERNTNPYVLSDEMLDLLKKRNKWERGWEDVAYSERMIHERHKKNKKELKHTKKDVILAPEGKHKHKHRHKHGH